jgi:hypothetical protein
MVVAYDWLPVTCLVAVLAVFAVPLRGLSHGGRGRFLATLRRVGVGGLAEARDGKFGDILLADVLTSYAKVLGDLYVVLCMFVTPRPRSEATITTADALRPDRSCGGAVVVPLILALPSLIRLRQCLIEYVRVRRAPRKESTGWGGQHLANALKYASAFPVIILSALQRNLPTEEARSAGASLNRAWLVALLVNSLYSFYWDVAKDWDLTLFSGAREREARDHPYGLRRRLVVGPPGLYYAVIVADLVLRCTWSLKLSPHLDRLADFESSIFIVELLEVLRRWVWIIFRVETEWLRNSSPSSGLGLGIDDILLGDYDYSPYDDDDD